MYYYNLALCPKEKKNYQEMNLVLCYVIQDFIEKLKEKKIKEQEEKALKYKKYVYRREKLKRKILGDANKNKDSENYIRSDKNVYKRRFESLPKIQPEINDPYSRKDHRYRHISFLKALGQKGKEKKDLQELYKKKQEKKIYKLKEYLGFNNVESKIKEITVVKPKTSQSLQRSRSYEGLTYNGQEYMPRTHKDFNKKNEEYLEKLKNKREQERIAKYYYNARKYKLKNKLKNFVMVTVKKNVLDGVYDEYLYKSEKKKSKIIKQKTRELDDEYENISYYYGSSSYYYQQNCPRRKMRSFPYISDLSEWKKKNRIEQNDKVYIITGGYGELKKALKYRGWYNNPDRNSPCFDFKYTLQARYIDYANLSDFQIVNHFQKAGCITTKVGLCKSLRNLKYIRDTSYDNFFPKCFDLNYEDDFVAFETHFKICKAVSILKIYESFVMEMQTNPYLRQKNKPLIQDLKLRTYIALEVCKKNIYDVDYTIDRKKTVKIVTEKYWEILAQDYLNYYGLAKKKHEYWLKSIDCKFGYKSKYQKPKKKKGSKKKAYKKTSNPEGISKKQYNYVQGYVQNYGDLYGYEYYLQEYYYYDLLFTEVQTILAYYKRKFPQYKLTGHNNIWILKPAGLSRGRGITCYNNLVEISDHVKCKESQWIAQKYIENPLVILKRKFDIRQWVLITDFNPLTIWFYEYCYIRFSAYDYDAKNVQNKFIHLTNNAIGSGYKGFGTSAIKGNMFFQYYFAKHLQYKYNYDVFTEKIKPQMKEIVKNSMMCGMEHIYNRKNTHELYGYDFMVDEDYKVWLIEINSSPSMDYSTHVTTKLVKYCLHDIVKVVVDYASAPKKEKKNVDTGKWKRIYKGVEIPDKPISTGLNLCLEGVQVKKPKKGMAANIEK